MIEKVYLETDDEITSVIDKIKKTKSDEVEIIVPKRATLIQSIVNLKLLKRQSDLLKKNVTLFINDEKGINLAKKADLKIKTNIQKKQIESRKAVVAGNEVSRKISSNKIKKKSEGENKDIVKKAYEKNEIPNKTNNERNESNNNIFSGITKKVSNFNDNIKDDKDEKKPGKDENKFFNVNSKNKVHLLPAVNLRSFLIFFGVSILVIALIFMMILPTANINVKTKTEPFSTSFDVVVSNNIDTLDIDNMILPAEIITHEEKSERKKFSATGEKEIGEKARGEITVYNNYSSDPITLVSSTRFASSDKIFYTLHEITIPGASIDGGSAVAGSTKVRVEAENEGEDYNIAPTRFIIPNLSADRQQDIYGESAVLFSGGLSNVAKVVSEEDYEKAKNELFESTFGNMIESISKKLNDEKLLAAGIMKKEITEINSSPGVNEEAEEFELEVQVRVVGYSVNRDDIDVIINNKFIELVPSEKYIINNDISQGINFEPIDGVISDENSISAKINITKQVAWKLDEKRINEAIKGKNIDDTKNYLMDDDNILGAEVELWPFWVRTVPKSTKKIKITLDTDNNNDTLNLN